MIIEIQDHLIPIESIQWCKLGVKVDNKDYKGQFLYFAIHNNNLEIFVEGADEDIRREFDKLKEGMRAYHDRVFGECE